MPGGDKTGPRGAGQLTGRQMGYCAGYDQPGFNNLGYGRRTGRGFNRDFGIGRGRGIRRGLGFGNAYGYLPDESILVPQKTALENEIRILKDQLSFLEKQLSETDKKE